MRAVYFTLCICLVSLVSIGQSNRFVSINAAGTFNFHTRGLYLNDAGLGINLDVSVFSKHKLQVLAEGSSELFMGDKLLRIDSFGKEDKAVVVKSIKLGLQYFIFKKIAVSVMLGPSWHRIETRDFTNDYGYKLGITGFLGRREKFVTKLFMISIPAGRAGISYLGFGLGYRIY